MSHFVAGPALARAIAEQEQILNTDDRTLVEFAFARTANHQGGFDATELLATARARGEDRPAVRGEVEWDRVDGRAHHVPHVRRRAERVFPRAEPGAAGAGRGAKRLPRGAMA